MAECEVVRDWWADPVAALAIVPMSVQGPSMEAGASGGWRRLLASWAGHGHGRHRGV
jgi:hypothetical protein